MRNRIEVVSMLMVAIILMCGGVTGCDSDGRISSNMPTDTTNAEKTTIYEVRDGILTGYFGDDSAVELPDTVVEVGKDAFRDSKIPIKSITIGKNVTNIDGAAFNGLSDLVAVYVDDENSSFVSNGEFLVAKDGSVLFSFGTCEFDPSIFDYAESICDDQSRESEFRVFFGGAELYCRIDVDDGSGAKYYTIEQVCAYSESVGLHINIEGDHALKIYSCQDLLLITDYAYSIGDTYMITEYGIWEHHNAEPISSENYNDAIVTYFCDDGGNLSFVCRPRKYLFTGSVGDLLSYSVGRDEVYEVTGSVSIVNGNPILTATSETTLSDKYKEEQLLTEFEATNEIVTTRGKSKYESIEDLFEQNKKVYERFEFVH